jgi:hypothetical protein
MKRPEYVSHVTAMIKYTYALCWAVQNCIGGSLKRFEIVFGRHISNSKRVEGIVANYSRVRL